MNVRQLDEIVMAREVRKPVVMLDSFHGILLPDDGMEASDLRANVSANRFEVVEGLRIGPTAPRPVSKKSTPRFRVYNRPTPVEHPAVKPSAAEALDDAGDLKTAIHDVVSEYKEDFEAIFSTALRAMNNIVPAQPNNEIRNFSGHLARALSETDIDKARLELARARRHLRFATYDTLAILLLYREAYVKDYVQRLERKTGAQPFLRAQLAEIVKLRRETPVVGVNNDDLDGVVADANTIAAANEHLMKAIVKCNELARELEGKFSENVPQQFIIPFDLPTEVGEERRKAITAVWTYTGALAALLSVIGFAALRSYELLLPIAVVCGAGGLIGTFIALTEPPKPLSVGDDRQAG